MKATKDHPVAALRAARPVGVTDEELRESGLPEYALTVIRRAPKAYQRGYLLALTGRVAARAAIRLFCLQCVGWSRPESAACTSRVCPLWQQGRRAGCRDEGRGAGRSPLETLLTPGVSPEAIPEDTPRS